MVTDETETRTGTGTGKPASIQKQATLLDEEECQHVRVETTILEHTAMGRYGVAQGSVSPQLIERGCLRRLVLEDGQGEEII